MASELYPRLKLQGNQIRLLRLFPGVEGQLIECELILSSTDNAKAYEALSYEWGNQAEREEIQVCNERFSITRSLWTALCRFRSKTCERTLWVDALCINRNDNHERSRQVKMMDVIYRNASRVLAWLGEAGDDGDHGMKWNEFQTKGSVDLHDLLLSSSTFGATDPSDRVFALLSLSNPEARSGVAATINYNQSCARAYRELATWLIQGNLGPQDMRILSRVVDPLLPWDPELVADGTGENPAPPKWVPKLNDTKLQGQSWAWRVDGQSYLASGNAPCSARIDGDRLKVAGATIDVVKEVLPFFGSEDCIQNINSLLPMANIAFRALRRLGRSPRHHCPPRYRTVRRACCAAVSSRQPGPVCLAK